MVHIINGEIVQDDDPRVLARKQSQGGGAAAANAGRRRPIAGLNSLGDTSSQQQQQQQQHGAGAPQAAGASPLQGLARTLCLDGTVTIPGFFGFAPRPVQKIYLALSAVSVLVFGWQALIFLGVAFCLTA